MWEKVGKSCICSILSWQVDISPKVAGWQMMQGPRGQTGGGVSHKMLVLLEEASLPLRKFSMSWSGGGGEGSSVSSFRLSAL